MSESDCVKLLNLTIEKERKLEKNYSDFVHNFSVQWKKVNDSFRNRLTIKKKEEIVCKSLDHQIGELEMEIGTTRSNLLGCELQATERKIKLSHVENEIATKSNEQENLKKQYEVLEINKNKLKKILNILRETESLYDEYLACNVRNEGSNIYLFSFIHDGRAVGAMRFKFNERKNHFIVLDTKPVNIVPDSMIQKFNETQDTQWLLCNFRQLLGNGELINF